MDCSTPIFSVLHYLPEFAQIHVHWVGDTIQPSHPLLPFCPFAFSLSLSIRISSNESALCIRRSKHWSSSFSISPSNEYLGLRFPPPYHRCENDSLVKFGIRETSCQLSTSSAWMKTLTWNMKVVRVRGSKLFGLLLKLETLCMNCS